MASLLDQRHTNHDRYHFTELLDAKDRRMKGIESQMPQESQLLMKIKHTLYSSHLSKYITIPCLTCWTILQSTHYDRERFRVKFCEKINITTCIVFSFYSHNFKHFQTLTVSFIYCSQVCSCCNWSWSQISRRSRRCTCERSKASSSCAHDTKCRIKSQSLCLQHSCCPGSTWLSGMQTKMF